ncbi:MAG: tRNA lysidine(34) synthetase TilS, partial [Anaerolineae bacterium]|nr:tRNA lysidine(34) synthetase TilS [Anaerolineae bacterium]
MYQKFFQTIQKHNLIPPHTMIVVAVSGGADSLALLHLLRDIRKRLRCDLHVATLDHGLRGEAGAADARFVAETAASWGLPVTVGQVSVPALMSQTGQGLEAAARRARYAFLAQTAQTTGAAVIASAHHADDQAETILLHLLRGAGLNGLRGMAYRAPVPGYPHLTLIRPLLNVTRTEIDSYCREHGLVPREDASNQDVAMLRNRIRAEVLPRLRTINPQIAQALISLADNAAVDQD